MAIDIQKLFEDIIPDAAKQDRNDGVDRVNAVSQLGGTAALLSPGRERRMRQAATGIAQPLFGVSFETPEEKLKKTLQGVDVRTPEGEDAAFKAISAIDGNKAIQFRIAMQEQKRAQQTADADTLRASAQNRGVDADLERTDVMRDQNATANERLALDAQEFEFNVKDQNRYRTIQEEMNRIDLLKAELANKDFTNQDKRYMMEAYDAAQEQLATGAVSIGLASQWESYKPASGFRGSAYEGWKNFMGTQDEVSTLRRNTTRMVNGLALAGLPKGSASDKDVELVKAGFPDATWNDEQLASYMRGAAKVAFIEAERLERKLNWLNEHNGSVAGFAEEWRRVGQEDGFIEGLETKYNVNFLEEGEEVPTSGKTLDELIAEEEQALAAKQANPNSTARQNQRRSTQFR